MAFLHRKMLVRPLPGKDFTFSIICCRRFPPPPPPPPQYDDMDDVGEQRSDVTLPLTTMICIVCGALLSLLFVIYLYLFIRRSRQNQAMVSGDATRRQEEEDGDIGFSGEEGRGTHVDHHVWHIATFGLRRSAIDSITAFRYKKEERLIDGTECSVCLNEFQEDESLRLLPKCSHAFHVDCIDAWLLSHKNCPLCRAPVLNETVPESGTERLMNHSDNIGSSNETTSEERSGNTSEIGDGTENKDRSDVYGFRNTSFLTRAQSDLANHCRRSSSRTMRRSFSIGDSLQRAPETRRRPFHLGAKLFSWRSTRTRIQDPVLRTGSEPV